MTYDLLPISLHIICIQTYYFTSLHYIANDFASHYCVSRGKSANIHPFQFEDGYTSGENYVQYIVNNSYLKHYMKTTKTYQMTGSQRHPFLIVSDFIG